MKLTLQNFTKIEQAKIRIDGITVIAGDNNTGKSTVGKALFSLFHSVFDLHEKIREQKQAEVEIVSRTVLKNSANISMGRYMEYARRIARLLKPNPQNTSVDLKEIRQKVRNVLDSDVLLEGDRKEIEEMTEELSGKIYKILDLSEQTITLEILTRYFCDVFHNQINSLVNETTDARIEIELKDKKATAVFTDNRCREFHSEIPILRNAVYIDNPFVADHLGKYADTTPTDACLKKLLGDNGQNDVLDGVIGSVLTQEKLSEVYRTLDEVVDGTIMKKTDGRFYLEKKGFHQPIHIGNLSNGLKSFVIVKLLLEKGALQEKDVLILDEPEIHLHPKWQLIYARLIVLLQKYFDLSIVITTHSPYFLDALHLYSVKYGIAEKTNYYLSEMEENQVIITNVNDNIEMIYQKMSSPIQELETLRYELNNQE